MKKYNKVLIVLFLLIIQIYLCNITLLPNNLILLKGEMLNINTIYGLTVEKAKSDDVVFLEASSNINKNKVNDVGVVDVSLNLFGKIPVKKMKVNVIPETTVIPIGKAIGMKLYTDGVLIVGMSEINGKKPYESSGLTEGDRIIKVNSKKIGSTNELISEVNNSKGQNIDITYRREEKTITTSIQPVKTNDNQYKLGLWVRDAAAGVGTMTFYEPNSESFAALGHGIADIDTSELISIAKGELVTTQIISITKGRTGVPR